jgi:hypothetical protein
VNFTVISSAPPIFGPVNFNGSALVMTGSNGNPGASYYLLATTNLALPIMNWTVLSTNTFDGAGNFSFTNTAPTGPQQYFMLRLQ